MNPPTPYKSTIVANQPGFRRQLGHNQTEWGTWAPIGTPKTQYRVWMEAGDAILGLSRGRGWTKGAQPIAKVGQGALEGS